MHPYNSRFWFGKVFLILLFLFSCVFFSPDSFAKDQEATSVSTESTLEILTRSVQKILDLLIVALEPKEPSPVEGVITTKSVPPKIGNQTGCAGLGDTNHLSWPSSSVRKKSLQWDTSIFPVANTVQETGVPRQLADINGDGLLDYISVRKIYQYPAFVDYYENGVSVSGFVYEESCIALNNGNGWDIKFRCVVGLVRDEVNTNKYYVTYYGDCADISK